MHGYSDPTNKKSKYEIAISKDNENLIEMNYLKNQDLYGVQFKDIVNQYIVIENNNLKEFASKLGIDSQNIPNKIESTSTDLNYAETNKILNKYLNIVIENIPEEKYSKIDKTNVVLGDKNVEADGYQIKLKTKDVQKILTKILENAKNDNDVLNLINNVKNEEITLQEYQNNIDNILFEISGEIPNEENKEIINISIYKQGKNAIKMSLNITLDETGKMDIALDKTSNGLVLKCENTNSYNPEEINSLIISKTENTEEQESFEIKILKKLNNEENSKYIINLSRTGKLSSNSVIFNLSIPVEMDEESINVQFTNTTNFSASIASEDFIEGNHLVINGLSSEQLNNLFTNLGNRLGEKLQDEMIISMLNSYSTLFDVASQAAQETQNAIDQENPLSNGITIESQDYNIE